MAYISPRFSDLIRSGILVNRGRKAWLLFTWSSGSAVLSTLGQDTVGSTSSPPGAALESNSELLGSWMASML